MRVKKIRAIAVATFRLLFRNGTGWGILIGSCLLAGFVFLSASAADTLLVELQLRARYGLGFGTVFISLGMLFTACVTVRHDIDRKLMHMLTSFPVPRWQIWAGKWVGLTACALVAILAVGLTLSACGWWLVRGWPRQEERAELATRFWRVHRLCEPVRVPLRQQVENEYRRRQRQALLPEDRTEAEVRDDLLKELRRAEQIVDPAGTRTWTFDLKGKPAHGENIVLVYIAYADEKRQLLSGSWRVRGRDGGGEWTSPVELYPYARQRLEIPVSVVPPGGMLDVTFQGEGTPHLIFPRDGGVRMFYDDGRLERNAAKLLLALGLHFAGVTAAGLACATALTLPVAVFVAGVLYIVAVASGFFMKVVEVLLWDEASLMRSVTTGTIQLGVWLARGLTLPPVLGPFSEGNSIVLADVARVWGGGFVVYVVVLAGLGMILLTRKELDRLY